MKITYGITCCNEHIEIKKLCKALLDIDEEDEIIILIDQNNYTDILLETVKKINKDFKNFLIIFKSLNKDFASFKNELIKHASGDILFQLDADEIPSTDLILNIKEIISSNPEADCFFVPRINTVKSITLDYILEWGWNVSKLESLTESKKFDWSNEQDKKEYALLRQYGLIQDLVNNDTYKYYIPIINFSDPQQRIFRLNKEIKWVNKVHEVLNGFKSYVFLPAEESYCLYHHKDINKQIKQNKLYNEI
jgi:glycosyltransferase involved in cell wall biosynthesis